MKIARICLFLVLLSVQVFGNGIGIVMQKSDETDQISFAAVEFSAMLYGQAYSKHSGVFGFGFSTDLNIERNSIQFIPGVTVFAMPFVLGGYLTAGPDIKLSTLSSSGMRLKAGIDITPFIKVQLYDSAIEKNGYSSFAISIGFFHIPIFALEEKRIKRL